MTSVDRDSETEPVNFPVYLLPTSPLCPLANKAGLSFSWIHREGLGLRA